MLKAECSWNLLAYLIISMSAKALWRLTAVEGFFVALRSARSGILGILGI